MKNEKTTVITGLKYFTLEVSDKNEYYYNYEKIDIDISINARDGEIWINKANMFLADSNLMAEILRISDTIKQNRHK